MFFQSGKPTGTIDYIIAGLGNPGREYENTRHNAGFLALDVLALKYGCKVNRIRFKGRTGECTISGRRCLLLRPSTFMNLSGQSVTGAMQFYKIPPERTVILFDDISLDMGAMRIRRKGSDGGHNGMKNIIYLSGSDRFPRIKLGIGKKPHPDYALKDWVLSRFSRQELEELQPVLDRTAEAVGLIVGGDIDEAMNRFN